MTQCTKVVLGCSLNQVQLLTDYIYVSYDSMYAGDGLTDILGLHIKCKDQLQALSNAKVKVFRKKSKVCEYVFHEMSCLSNIK